MLKIIKHVDYLEAIFLGGNLYAFTLIDLISQLRSIYSIEINLFEFNLN